MSNFQDVISETITTTLIKKPNTPQIKIENPFGGDMFVNGIDCLFDTLFTRKGELVIEIGNIIVYDSRSGSTKNIGKITVGVGKVMKRNDFIKIFAWNKIDTDTISAEFKIGIGKTLEPFTAQTILQSPDVVNRFNSDDEILFPFRIYNDEIVTALLDMKGYSKLIINMASQTIEDNPIESFTTTTNIIPTHEIGKFTEAGHSNEYELDDGVNQYTVFSENSDLTTTPVEEIPRFSGGSRNNTYLVKTTPLFTKTIEIIFDMLDVDNFGITFDYTKSDEILNPSFLGLETTSVQLRLKQMLARKFFIQISESDSPTGTFDVVSAFPATESAEGTTAQILSKRYAKIELKIEIYPQIVMQVFSGTPNTTLVIPTVQQTEDSSTLISNVFNQFTKNGIASLSFEELNDSDNEFTEFIPSTEFGTVTEGEAIKEQIGDVNNVSITGKAYFLPSTQTGFRAKLTITNGGVETGVSIRKIT